MATDSRAPLLRAVAVGALALCLRLPRVVLRWDEVSIAYAAYAEPAVLALKTGALSTLPSAWVGLHPPLFAAIWALGERYAPVPALGLGLCASASAAACAVLAARWGWAAGLVLATAPASILYAAEVNNYPLAALLIAVALSTTGARWGAAAGLAGWGHVLGLSVGAALVAQRLWTRGRAALPGAAAALLVVLPVLVGAVVRARWASTYEQPQLALDSWAAGAVAVLGPAAVAQVALLLFAAPRCSAARPALLALFGFGAALAGFLFLGVAAPHQHPYLSLFVVVVAAAWGPVEARRLQWVAVSLGFLGAAPLVRDDLLRVQGLWQDQSRVRAVDAALREARCGDLLWLVAPALQADDDKTDHSPVLWRLRPWTAMRRADHVPHDLADWRFGHPRWVGGLELRTSTELGWGPVDQVMAAAQQRGAAAWFVVYDHQPAQGLAERVERSLRPWSPLPARTVGEDLGLGADLLFVVPAPAGAVRQPPLGAGCPDA